MDLKREEILLLPAGPDLDGLVAELIFDIDRRATTPELRRLACSSVWNDKPGEGEWLELEGQRYPLDRTGGQIYSSGESWIWASRFGKPYQPALEKHVAQWRLPAMHPYSSDVTSAWEIVRKLIEEGWFFNLLSDSDNQFRWACIFGLPSALPWVSVVSGCETAPLAICRAACCAMLAMKKVTGV